ncbi:unnamed protein product [Didymodactylos carnosus]|uniref:V-SNARE coiled-coil homology domain-containing protein n=1 Tax=Didymodactylos carnosus TaxID=1234261 RepID=A0A813VWT9_9BILA|nr:unnamed protein product [Didymodactylos carnosus]CAF0844813.1 unnamed protein product [Didymodactylos carnosus]CAF3549564.1 unnamed protein product [Didymodactylos carnosus]CAF3632289.1 unnamed protein product [Didymodactylos carnosus]
MATRPLAVITGAASGIGHAVAQHLTIKMESFYNYDYQFRLIVVGDSTVGKSSLLRNFCDGVFSNDPDPTVGVDFNVRIVEVKPGVFAKLQLWDTAGQERFRSITRAYYRNSVGVLLIYDTTSYTSFTHVTNWLNEARQQIQPYQAVFLLVGTKIDRDGRIHVQTGWDGVKSGPKSTNTNIHSQSVDISAEQTNQRGGGCCGGGGRTSNGDKAGGGPGVGGQGSKRLAQTQAQVDEVVDIMRQNVDKVLERDKNLSILDDRAGERELLNELEYQLQYNAAQFEQQAGKLKRKFWWKNIKMMIILGIVATIFTIILIAWIYSKVKAVKPVIPQTSIGTTVSLSDQGANVKGGGSMRIPAGGPRQKLHSRRSTSTSSTTSPSYVAPLVDGDTISNSSSVKR